MSKTAIADRLNLGRCKETLNGDEMLGKNSYPKTFFAELENRFT
jgi:hypothetical protein